MPLRDLRASAREGLRGHWGAAIAVGVITTILCGGSGSSGSASSFTRISTTTQNDALSEFFSYFDLANFVSRETMMLILTIVFVSAIVTLVVVGAILMGNARFQINLLTGQGARFTDLFSQIHRLWAGFSMIFLQGLFVYLWSLLLVIPGIIASYRYAMMPYLMAEFPELSALDAMRESKRLMRGNKWRLFCLQLSFLGWLLLGCLTLGIGLLWVYPYQSAAEAAFYLEITGRRPSPRVTQGPEF